MYIQEIIVTRRGYRDERMMAGIRAKGGKCACGEKKEEESSAGPRETLQCWVSTNHVRDKA